MIVIIFAVALMALWFFEALATGNVLVAAGIVLLAFLSFHPINRS